MPALEIASDGTSQTSEGYSADADVQYARGRLE